MSTAPRPRNRRGQGDRLRAELLAAATDLLDAGCVVTLRSVARKTGVAPPSIYPHFPDQQAILLAVARQGYTELVSRLRFAASVKDSRQRLHAICWAYLDYAQAHPHRYRAMALPGNEVSRLLTDSLAACAATGYSTTQNPAADAIALWLGLHGLAHQRAVTRFQPWPADIAHRVTTALARLNPDRSGVTETPLRSVFRRPGG
ncbi:TetR/AcrR family transcriptional regulator [Actinocrispum sp. NPDC049592]|uniref:TetR/AcrR family transcriptional regulator n=1 Tax=Actinocrispum sp. NPDC049592 TaxID=3154835 RepID=UPI0034227F79